MKQSTSRTMIAFGLLTLFASTCHALAKTAQFQVSAAIVSDCLATRDISQMIPVPMRAPVNVQCHGGASPAVIVQGNVSRPSDGRGSPDVNVTIVF
jgi:hypothetical protein